MKAKNILMTFLLVTGTIAAKAAGYPAELALVSQPVMVYDYNSITVYYDVENIGDYTYRGDICLYLNPDDGYCYAEKYVKVKAGRIKRVAITIPAYHIKRGCTFTIMPYYEMGNELYSFTTFEYFEPIAFRWDGPRNERWVVITVPACPTYYHRPGTFRYYYDGFYPPKPHHHKHYAGGPRPMDPMHHTYSYHHNNGYPAIVGPGSNHAHGDAPTPNGNNVTPKPNGNNNTANNGATVDSHDNHAGSMSSRSGNGSRNGTSSSGATTRPNTATSGATTRPSATTSGATTRPSATTSGTSRPSTSNSSSMRSSSSTSRPNGTSSSASNTRSGSTSSRNSSSSTSSQSSNSNSNRSSSGGGRR